jgi:hypothetical protein
MQRIRLAPVVCAWLKAGARSLSWIRDWVPPSGRRSWVRFGGMPSPACPIRAEKQRSSNAKPQELTKAASKLLSPPTTSCAVSESTVKNWRTVSICHSGVSRSRESSRRTRLQSLPGIFCPQNEELTRPTTSCRLHNATGNPAKALECSGRPNCAVCKSLNNPFSQ